MAKQDKTNTLRLILQAAVVLVTVTLWASRIEKKMTVIELQGEYRHKEVCKRLRKLEETIHATFAKRSQPLVGPPEVLAKDSSFLLSTFPYSPSNKNSSPSISTEQY